MDCLITASTAEERLFRASRVCSVCHVTKGSGTEMFQTTDYLGDYPRGGFIHILHRFQGKIK